MDRDFRQGRIAIDFVVEPFVSPARILRRTLGVVGSTWYFLALTTLIVFVPGKLALQFVCSLFDVPMNGVLMYLLQEASDLVLGALAVPAVVYGLIGHMRRESIPPMLECLRWGRRQWAKTLWNKVKVEITVMLWGALLVIPGIIAMVRLVFTDVIVAVEADAAGDVLGRSRQLGQNRRRPIFLVLAPLGLLDMAAFVVLGRIPGATDSRLLFALADSVLACAGQLATVAALLMYLGVVEPGAVTPVRKQRTATGPRAR
jgi:hypothetical protein